MNKSKAKNRDTWFAIKCIFRHPDIKIGPRQWYEERIILVKSDNDENAMDKGEKEAKQYAKGCSDGCEFTGHVEAWHLFDDKIEDLTEIYFDKHLSNLSSEKYIKRYFPADVMDDCQKHRLKHRWYNKDNKNSGCYNCRVVKEGQLWKQ